MSVVSGFNYYRELTIDNSKIDAALSSYPVMVKLTSSNFDFSKVLSPGLDIVFSDESDNLLDFEVEYFDQTEEKAVFHVRVPTVASLADTIMKMHYGKTGATDQSNKTGVWDSDFVGVWHMGGVTDSTGNANNLTAGGGPSLVDGLNAKAYSFDGANDYLERSGMSFTYPLTLQYLAYVDIAENSEQNVFQITDASADKDMMGINYYNASTFLRQFHFNSAFVNLNTKSIAASAYVLASAVYVNNDFTFHVDGSVPIQNTGSYPIPDNLDRLALGAFRDSTPSYKKGVIDEARLSTVVRSDAWIKADDYNLRLNILLSVGAEQGGETPATNNRRFVQLI